MKFGFFYFKPSHFAFAYPYLTTLFFLTALMNKIILNSEITIYNSAEELPFDIQKSLQKAIEIRENAYAPYSKFKVGVAVVLENGEVVLGTNQENAAYPSGLCAERVAVFQAGTLYPEVPILALLISAASETNTTNTPIPPCGACRQAIAEYEFKQNKPIEIYFTGAVGQVYLSNSISNLLPLSFNKSSL